MDPLSAAGTFASIVGLICNFKSERNSYTSNEYQEFIGWLEEKRHGEIIEIIKANSDLCSGINKFLQEDNKIIKDNLNALGDIMLKLSSRIEGLSGIALAINTRNQISEQSLKILRQFEDSASSFFIEIKLHGRSVFQFDKGGQIEYEEPRFVEDDILTLLDLGMLRLDYNSKGGRVFYITRNAVEYLKYTN